METKLKQEEIEKIQELQKLYNTFYYEIGKIEHEKQILLEKIKDISSKEKKLIDELIQIYGKGSVNLDTFTFTPIS